ncbi:MAG: calcium-binding protein [Elainellaceae cyanobacterium]
MTVNPTGFEFRANTTTLDSQDTPSVAVSDNGTVVVVWESDGQDGSLEGIYAQRFDANGVPLGVEFRVNSFIVDNQANPEVAIAPNGQFVIVWESDGQDSDGTGVFAQRFNANGSLVGPEFRVNTEIAQNQDRPAVGMDANGNFIVTWTSEIQDGSGSGIFAQRYSSNGQPLGVEFQVNTETASTQENSAIAVSRRGDFVITWESRLQDGSLDGIFAQRYNSSGVPVGGEFQVNTETSLNQINPAIAISDDGSFVVAWQSQGQDGSFEGIFARRFAANGSRLGNEFQVNTTTLGTQEFPAVATDADGNFVVTWVSEGQDGSGDGIFGRAFDRNGTPIGEEFQVNTSSASQQTLPAIAINPAGQTVVVWQSAGQDGSSDGIFGQRFVSSFAIPGDDLVGDRTDNIIRGSAGDDTIAGLGGDDTLLGLGGNDVLRGGGGEDVLRGGSGDDVLRGGGRSDRLRGGGGEDVLRGGGGEDDLRGGIGNDRLIGGGRDDVLVGNGGDDILIGRGGDDDLRGGLGADIFLLEVGSGEDTIQDFHDGQDFFALAGGLAFDELRFRRNGNRTIIRVGNERIAIVEGVRPVEITEADFTTL